MIADENLRLGTLVERVLQSAVLDKGSFKIKKEPLNIHTLLSQAIDSSQVKANSNGGRIIAQLGAELDEYAVDKVHMTNVFYNLLDNAIKYSKDEPGCVGPIEEAADEIREGTDSDIEQVIKRSNGGGDKEASKRDEREGKEITIVKSCSGSKKT